MFIYSLPLFFNYFDFGSPFELFIIFATLLIILHLSAPFVNSEIEDKPFNYPLYYYCLYAWTGQLTLWRVFWPFFICLNLGFLGADYAVRAGIFTVSSWDDTHFMLFVFGVFWTISVWRNSPNTSSKNWIAYARLMTIALFLEIAIKLFIRIEHPRVLFNCTERVLDYLVCF